CGVREEYLERTAFARFTTYVNLALMCIHHSCHIAQSQTKSFHIVYITGTNSVKFFKNILNLFPGHSLAFVFYLYNDPAVAIFCPDINDRNLGRILVGIVQKIMKNIAQVIFITFDNMGTGCQVKMDISTSSFDLEF